MDNYVGKRLDGRYEIQEIIGVGGMAVVYKAYDNIDQKIVAVKILKDEFLTNEEFKRRFKNESKAIAVLSHPNIVKVLDVSFGDRLQYIVMEYVEGITLKEYIEQQGKVKIREALYFTMQILRALQHAHDKGIVHRDIKPQNIMLISNGTLKVTDFGIATFSRDETKTMTGTAIGSVHYISPEQAKGSVTDAKSDIYSVGVVLYEMLTGSLPFQSENAVSVALMQLQQEPKRPRELNPDIPIGLEQIVMKAMQKNAADRYQSAAEMLVDLSEFSRNPNIKFDYNFFVDSQPTKYIPSNEIKKKLDEEEQKHDEEQKALEDEEARAAAQKKKTIGILSGVLGGLVLFIIIMVAIFASGSSKKLTVPNFVGLNYAEDILANQEYSEYWDYIETKFVVDSTVDDGMVISQSPAKGKKISEGKKILLEIASNNSKIAVPDVYGNQLAIAQNMIRSEGFITQVEYDTESDGEEGVVIRTSPARGDLAAQGSTVIIYIPSPNGTGDTVTVPVLAGETLSSAKKILEDLGLILDISGSTNRDSDRPKGQIIGNAFAEQEVPKGTKIAVYISTGQQGHVDINIDLPNVGGEKGKLEVKLNGISYSKETVTLDGSAYTVTVGGSGSSNTIKIYIDGQKVYSAKADFANDVLSGVDILSDIKTYSYTTTQAPSASTAAPTSEPSSAPTTSASTQPTPDTTKSTTERQTVDHDTTDPSDSAQ
ncbi:MAG: Stk1 family PASTA domain-containing Ser/Thr kinase [Oscillospiraceae bacterium]|nr:Stk1 family PASTA domain-containing Ser/Thr kinase [Oscillospiraceae bacterium]